eukprot:UN05474
MGFTLEQATDTLNITNGDVQKATSLLLSQTQYRKRGPTVRRKKTKSKTEKKRKNTLQKVSEFIDSPVADELTKEVCTRLNLKK